VGKRGGLSQRGVIKTGAREEGKRKVNEGENHLHVVLVYGGKTRIRVPAEGFPCKKAKRPSRPYAMADNGPDRSERKVNLTRKVRGGGR